MTRTRRLFLVYLAALVASRLFLVLGSATEAASDEAALPDGMQAATVRVENGQARLAYRALGAPSSEAVLLLHGSPGSLQDFASLAADFGPDRYVLVPDMLGFGRSTRSVPDHSFDAQAAALVQFLDQLDVSRVHVVGFSWGGGVALELAAKTTDRLASVVLVSAIGVQELELLGRFELNRLVHAFQHAAVVGLDWAIPHFGMLVGSPIGRGFTRSFLDSDQRPMREILENFEGPMLIVHGREDLLVPAAAAREHHRLVPQSRLVWIDGGHLVLWARAGEVTAALVEWFREADLNALPRRADADPTRVAAAAAPFDGSAAGPQDGIGWIVFMLLVFAASMVSEDLTCAGVGLLVATGQVGFGAAVAACVSALVLGDLVLYGAGRSIGPPLLRRIGREPRELGSIGDRLRARGGLAVLLGRFVPGARLPTYVAAGALAYPVLLFTGWLVLAALLWAPFLVGVSALGGRALELESASPHGALVSGLLLVLSIALAARFVPRLVTKRGRRLLQARFRRLLRWEFWPIWAIYGPLVPSLLRMMFRYRTVRGPTLVNPPIPGGGLAGESKAAIGEGLDRCPEHAIETVVLAPDEDATRVDRVARFMRDRDIAFPLVLKPDMGERGRGVEIVHDLEAVHGYLESHPDPTLAQAHVQGEEFGVFYVRRPGEAKGELFSIARKTPRFVVGNGVDPIEVLLLDDPICSPMAEKLLLINADRLEVIPARGDTIQVTQIGTHSLGCRFLVGEDLRTPALEAAFDRLSQTLDLDFGRYDVLSPDEASFRRGEFQVVEFNGLTGEAAHMYDPRYGFFAGLRILRAQWEIAFEIGAAHLSAGRRPLGWSALARLVWHSRG